MRKSSKMGTSVVVRPSGAPQAGWCVVDYPQQDEIVRCPEYTVRVGAPNEQTSVDVSIDGGPWRACRPSHGYWWHDWSGYGRGEHELIARARCSDGLRVSPPRRFKAEF